MRDRDFYMAATFGAAGSDVIQNLMGHETPSIPGAIISGLLMIGTIYLLARIADACRSKAEV